MSKIGDFAPMGCNKDCCVSPGNLMIQASPTNSFFPPARFTVFPLPFVPSSPKPHGCPHPISALFCSISSFILYTILLQPDPGPPFLFLPSTMLANIIAEHLVSFTFGGCCCFMMSLFAQTEVQFDTVSRRYSS